MAKSDRSKRKRGMGDIEHLAETVAVFYFDAFFWLFFFSVLRVVYLIVLRHDDDTAQSI